MIQYRKAFAPINIFISHEEHLKLLKDIAKKALSSISGNNPMYVPLDEQENWVKECYKILEL